MERLCSRWWKYGTLLSHNPFAYKENVVDYTTVCHINVFVFVWINKCINATKDTCTQIFINWYVCEVDSTLDCKVNGCKV